MNKFYRIVILLLLVLLFPLSILHAQILGEWKIYSSYSTINDISASPEGIYYISSQGGLFVVEEGSIQSRFTTIDGMHRLDGVKSEYDEINKRLIIAYPDGAIDLFDIDNQSFQQIGDVERVSEFTSKGINDIEIKESEVFIATDFGIVVFDRDRFFVTNSYLNLGDFSRGTTVNDLTFSGDSIYAATTQGIAIASTASNLVDATNWRNIVLTNLMNNEIITIEATESEVYAIASDTLFRSNNGHWIENLIQPISNPEFLKSVGQDVLVASSNRVIRLRTDGTTSLEYDPESANISTITHLDNTLLIGTRENGIIELNSEDRVYNPSGPYLNFFSDLIFEDGILLGSATNQFPQSDPFNPIRGYYILRDNGWENYNRNTNSVLQESRFSSVYAVEITDENFFAGSWGGGIVVHSKEDNEISIFDETNSGFSGISANSDFIVISGIDTDSQQNTWAISFISNLPLNVYYPPDNEWTHFSSLPISSDELYYRLFIDSSDKLWIPLIDISNNGKGLLVVDPGQDPFDESDDTFRKLNSSENSGNLPDDNVVAVAEDLNGEVWIGTTRGIARFIFPNFIVSSNNPSEFSAQWLINADTSATSRFLLRDVNVSAIAVNSANQKWVGSANQGLWLLNEDGSEILARYTSENSPLISDNITDVAINDENGEVFISTDLGLISFVEASVGPVNTMDELKVYPNPFVYSQHDQIVIEDLSDQTDIKIVGADGSVFASLESRGGRIIWNALDSNRNKLASGVYFVVALDSDGSEKGIGKIVIIR